MRGPPYFFPLIFLPPTVTLFFPILCDFCPSLDRKPFDLQEASQDAGNELLGRDDLHTAAGAGPMTSCIFICVFTLVLIGTFT